ncbi:MAG: hypothetical protein IPK72_22805 [Candidatus Eisenbacteria bacterium]|nr:hypothetical protein [Candidatus Eisenbacteria bacterium]
MRTHLAPVCAALLSLILASAAGATPPLLSSERFLEGDAARVQPVDVQDVCRISAGGSGYLAVWQDNRTNLLGFANMAYEPLTGNGLDIYGLRLDQHGNPIDPGPFVICQLGRNQMRPEVAWNEAAQAWLVVFTSERDDWYFFTDVLGVRVGADGSVLDSQPIALRPENNDPANDRADSPTVASDGTQWLAVWQDINWQLGGKPNLSAKRIAANGTMLDAAPVVLQQHPDYVFGPIAPRVAWATDEWLVVWERAGYDHIFGRRYAPGLAPLDAAAFQISTSGTHPSLATNGSDFLVSHRYHKVHRVTHAGVVLDPAGIPLASPNGYEPRSNDVAWDGQNWVVANSGPSGSLPVIWIQRISTGGAILAPGAFVLRPTGGDQYTPSLASSGAGTAMVGWSGRNISQQMLENIEGAYLRADNSVGSLVPISAGLRRQAHVRFISSNTGHVALFESRGGGSTRLLAQRLDEGGNAIDAEPVEVAAVLEGYTLSGEGTWNGSGYFFVWAFQGAVYGRRFDANLSALDAAPVLLFADTASIPGVSSIGGNYYIAYAHSFSGNQRMLKGGLFDGATLGALSARTGIGSGYNVWYTKVRSLGGRYFIVWQRQSNHDTTHSTTLGLFVDANGVAGTQFQLNSATADARDPDVVVAGDRAFITYADVDGGDGGEIEGRIMAADGSFLTAPFVIADAAGAQRFTGAGFDGERFLATWVDYRDVLGIEQLRGDIYAARISIDGVVEDPNGFAVTSGDLPEDLPQTAGASGTMLIAYSRLTGPAGAEVQRIGLATLGARAADVPPHSLFVTECTVAPNPSSGPVTLSFRNPLSTDMPLEIISLDGRRVARVLLSTGTTQWSWPGTRDDGAPAPAGVYFARLHTPQGPAPLGRISLLH